MTLKLTVLASLVAFVKVNGQISTTAPTIDYGDASEDDTVNLRAVGGYYTETRPRCVFPFEYQGKLHNGCLRPEDFPPHDADGNPAGIPNGGFSAAAATTGGVLGWCPHGARRDDHDPPVEFKPFYEYSEKGLYKKMWGYCHCEGGFFWQRLETQGHVLDEDCHLKTYTDVAANLYSAQCREYCDDTPGCQGFEFAKFAIRNTCRLFGCIGPSTTTIEAFFGEPLPNNRYKQQIKRPCEEATQDFSGTPIIIERNITGAPTTSPSSSPTLYPTNYPIDTPTSPPVVTPTTTPPVAAPTTTPPVSTPTKSPVSSPTTQLPTPFPTGQPAIGSTPTTAFPTSSPVVNGELPLPTPQPTAGVTKAPSRDEGNGEFEKPPSSSDGVPAINPVAYIAPLMIILLLSLIVIAVVKRQQEKYDAEEGGDEGADETTPDNNVEPLEEVQIETGVTTNTERAQQVTLA